MLLWETSGGESGLELSRRESEAARFSRRPPESREQNGVKTTANAGPRSCSSAASPDTGTTLRTTPAVPRQLTSVTPSALRRAQYSVGVKQLLRRTPFESRVAVPRTPVRTLSDGLYRSTSHSRTVDRQRLFGGSAGTPKRPIDEAQITAGRQTVDGPEMRFVFVYFWFPLPANILPGPKFLSPCWATVRVARSILIYYDSSQLWKYYYYFVHFVYVG